MWHFLEVAGEIIEIIKIGDDLGSQTSLMISLRMYHRILNNFPTDFIQFGKQRTKAKVLFHTDGDVFDLILDLIEIRVAIFNPIQTSTG